MSESTYEVNLRSPHTATINLAEFYNYVRLDAGKRIGLFDGGLVAYVETTVDYANNPASRNAANELSPRPVLLRPTIAVGATAAAIMLHNLHITNYQSLAASILIISDKIYDGISPATKTIMDDHAIDHPSFFHQPWAMMDFTSRHRHIRSYHRRQEDTSPPVRQRPSLTRFPPRCYATPIWIFVTCPQSCQSG